MESAENNKEKEIIALIDSFFGEIKETLPENRDMDKIFQMIHYEDDNEQFDEIRRDSFQNKVITDYKIMDIAELVQDFYCITMDIESNNDIEENIFYVAKVEEDWKIIFGTHNIPINIMENLNQNNIEIPVTTFSNEITYYPIKDEVLSK